MLSPFTRTRLIRCNGKKVHAHRWIMEQVIGRPLHPDEHVHHVNGDPLDNRIENLQIMKPRDHMCLHHQIYPDTKTCVICGMLFKPNPRKRKRQKCCSMKCVIEGRRIKAVEQWKNGQYSLMQAGLRKHREGV